MITSLDEHEIIPPVPVDHHIRTIAIGLLVLSAVLTVFAVFTGVVIGARAHTPPPKAASHGLERSITVCKTGFAPTDSRFHLVAGQIQVRYLQDSYGFGELQCVLHQLGTSSALVSQIGMSLANTGTTTESHDGLTYSWSVHPGLTGAYVMDMDITEESK